jgi:hypothetical protein
MRFGSAVLIVLLFAPTDRLRAADEAPVALPPFIVEEAAKGPPWRYAEAMGYEILSRCSDKVTRKVIESHYQLHQLLADILPPSLQLKMTVPRALIIYDEELQPAASKEVIANLLRDAGPAVPAEEYSPIAGLRGIRAPTVPARRYTFLPNLRLWDRDSISIFMIVRNGGFDADTLQLTQDYVTFMVKSRLPALPLWFVSGFLALHREIKYEGNRLTAPPLEWISEAHTSALRREGKNAPPVMPLADFFAGRITVADPEAPKSDVDPLKVWQSQAALFVRWGLDERVPGRRDAFLKFVEGCAAHGLTEEFFHDCFGFDFAEGREQLAAYLPAAVQRTMQFKPAKTKKLPAYALTNASDAQIARLKGDWERLEITYVKGLHPNLAPKYLEQARRTLRRAYDRDVRDPRMLAVMGLCEIDAGNDADAREYLEAAARLGPIRPRAYYELARLRFAEANAHPEASEGRLSIAQASQVFAPLFEARAQQPPLPEVYDLIADVWSRAAATPTRRHLAVFDEGVQLFPRRTALTVHAAELNLRFGFREEAGILADIAARNAGPADDAFRERIAALRAELTR